MPAAPDTANTEGNTAASSKFLRSRLL